MPATITDALAIVKMASHWMFASYIIGICLAVITLATGKFTTHAAVAYLRE
jgi:hypothetical protein